MATTLKNIQICDVPHHAGFTESYYFTLDPYWVNWFALVDGVLPIGITAITNPLNGCVFGFTVDELLVSGNTSITVNATKDTGESLGQFIINFEKGVCVSEIDICCDDVVYLKWLADTGGIQEWVFPGVREFEIRVGDALTFKNTSNQIQYSQRKDIYLAKRITSGDITLEQNVFIALSKISIQAWEYDVGNSPILIDNDSFKVYKTTDKFFDVSVQYIMADANLLQPQPQ
ncbi:hypothetical protein UFOVP1106_3 [uncultured Caudovirales phage]|uniref:Uncharacterized protein n=1 Tax=uncultured Caudovirales phage TaxID=2100421 RepID=A0A6J5QGT4_9CAUD|nr:hypothetical protein UFOVP1106_3 [uncultured Caudovirales phage]